MTVIVVRLDVLYVDSFSNSCVLVQLSQVVGEIRVVCDPTQVRFKMDVVHRIETNQDCEKAPIALSDFVSE